MSEPIDLDAIRARADATLPGPWTWREFPAGYEFVTPDNEAIRWPDEETAFEFAAHAREDVPALIAEVERLRAENVSILDHATGLTICRSPRCMVIYFRGDKCPGSTHTPATAPRTDDWAAQVLGDPETAEGAL